MRPVPDEDTSSTQMSRYSGTSSLFMPGPVYLPIRPSPPSPHTPTPTHAVPLNTDTRPHVHTLHPGRNCTSMDSSPVGLHVPDTPASVMTWNLCRTSAPLVLSGRDDSPPQANSFSPAKARLQHCPLVKPPPQPRSLWGCCHLPTPGFRSYFMTTQRALSSRVHVLDVSRYPGSDQ